MGTEVLPPQGYFAAQMGLNPPVITSRRKSHRKPFIKTDSRKRVVVQSETSTSTSTSGLAKTNHFVGNVTILKRGDSNSVHHQDLPILQQIRVKNSNSCRSEEIYAGSACYSSPSPRKVPFPKFSKKNEGMNVEDNATKDLRRLLGLN